MTTMNFDFDTIIERRGTGSEKWIKYETRDILPLWVADMDFASPPSLIKALRDRVDHGIFGYAQPTDSFVQSVRDWCRLRYGWEVEEKWLVWLPGLVSALNVTCRAFAGKGDAVMTAIPVYPQIVNAPRNMERELIAVPLQLRQGRWLFDWEEMERAVTPRTRLFLLCHPHNPVGQAFPPDELRRLGAFCEKHDLVLCSDEIHCDLILDDSRHVPAALACPDLAGRIFTLMAPSKTFNVPGLGCSFAVIPDSRLRARYQRAAMGIVPQVPLFGFTGCEAAFRFGEPWRRELLAYLRGNAQFLHQYLTHHLPGLPTTPVEATYLAWVDVTALGMDDPVGYFEEHGVGFSDGKFFGTPGYIRINFGCPRSTLEEGLKRMKTAVDRLPARI